MGFIPQIAAKTLYAYLTPLGRQYILDGDKVDFQVAYFTLHDDDVNYNVSSNMSGTTSYYTLPSGFVPDITGDPDTCIKSIAEGTNVNIMSTLSGSTILDATTQKLTVGRIGTDGNINTRVCTLQVGTEKIIGGSINPSLTTYTVQSFNVLLAQPVGDTAVITAAELANTQFYVKITQATGIQNFTINGVSTSNLLISPMVAASTPITITFQKASSVSLSPTINISFVVEITTYRSFVDLSTKSKVSYSASYTNPNGGNTSNAA